MTNYFNRAVRTIRYSECNGSKAQVACVVKPLSAYEDTIDFQVFGRSQEHLFGIAVIDMRLDAKSRFKKQLGVVFNNSAGPFPGFLVVSKNPLIGIGAGPGHSTLDAMVDHRHNSKLCLRVPASLDYGAHGFLRSGGTIDGYHYSELVQLAVDARPGHMD